MGDVMLTQSYCQPTAKHARLDQSGVAMINRVREWLRCTKHNIKHLRRFRLGFDGSVWIVREGSLVMRFPHYPYLAFHDIEGYLPSDSFVPRPGEVVLDAGACLAEFSVYAALKVGPRGKVIVIEPDAANRKIAETVLEMNGVMDGRVVVTDVAVWSSRTTLRFHAGLGGESTVLSADTPHPDNVISIPCRTIAQTLEDVGVSRLDFVKMDIEGAELEAIGGAALPMHIRPRYSIASYHIVNGISTAKQLPPILKPMGYSVQTGNPRHLTTWAWPTEQNLSGMQAE